MEMEREREKEMERESFEIVKMVNAQCSLNHENTFFKKNVLFIYIHL